MNCFFQVLGIGRVLPAVLVAIHASKSLAQEVPTVDRPTLAEQVTIYRDEWGVPHVWGKTNVAMVFGQGYAQAEDYFWQIEDNCIRSLGRYAEVAGEGGLRGDVLSRSFEVERRSREDFGKLDQFHRDALTAFVGGVNYYLANHPETKPRLIERFEPHYVLAMDRYMILDFVYGRSHTGKPKPNGFLQSVASSTGSNEWAIGPSKTKSGNAMLMINPHQPFYGAGQFYETHVISDEGINFSGACFYGSPIPALGFNEHLGWAYTTNDPDVADVFRVKFDVPDRPLAYRFGDEVREATEWDDTILVRVDDKTEERDFRFRKTHHGPVVRFEDPTTALTVSIAGLFNPARANQAFEMIGAKNFEEWYSAMRHVAIPMFNVAYADVEGNIFYGYNATMPVRDPAFDWYRPVDGNNPATAWKRILQFDELPQVKNPSSGYVQNCNSSPFVTTDDGNPSRDDFPSYMFDDHNEDKRRSKMSRKLLRETQDLTYGQFRKMVFDTTVYWALAELPRFKEDLARLSAADPETARKVRPFLEHLLDWNCEVTLGSTQASLCEAWYVELYGARYPGETLKNEFMADRLKRLEALPKAAAKLKSLYGSWKVSWGKSHRLQRRTRKPGVTEAAMAFSDLTPSVPSPGAPGPLGVIFTTYSAPGIKFLRPNQYAVVGPAYLAAIEFGERVRSSSLVPYGQSSDKNSPHYFDQAKLLSQKKLKTAWLYRDDVKENAVRSYHPGEELHAAQPQ